MKRYRSRTVKCKLQHRATSRAESGEESRKLRRRTSQLDPSETAVGSERGPTCRQRQFIDREGPAAAINKRTV
eukprot:7010537-Prymnesium_polylepis.2